MSALHSTGAGIMMIPNNLAIRLEQCWQLCNDVAGTNSIEFIAGDFNFHFIWLSEAPSTALVITCALSYTSPGCTSGTTCFLDSLGCMYLPLSGIGGKLLLDAISYDADTDARSFCRWPIIPTLPRIASISLHCIAPRIASLPSHCLRQIAFHSLRLSSHSPSHH